MFDINTMENKANSHNAFPWRILSLAILVALTVLAGGLVRQSAAQEPAPAVKPAPRVKVELEPPVKPAPRVEMDLSSLDNLDFKMDLSSFDKMDLSFLDKMDFSF